MTEQPSPLERATKNIVASPFVKGVVFFTDTGEITHSLFRTPEETTHLEEFIKGLASIVKMSNQLNMACQSIDCVFKAWTVLTCQMNEGNMSAVFFDRNANKRIIKMMLTNQFEKIQEDVPPSPARKPGASFLTVSPGKSTGVGVRIKPSLRPRLDIMRSALQKALQDKDGEETHKLMEAGIEKWAALGPVNKRELPVLADILGKNIHNPISNGQFFKDIEDIFLGIK